jgi:hypothetical protein
MQEAQSMNWRARHDMHQWRLQDMLGLPYDDGETAAMYAWWHRIDTFREHAAQVAEYAADGAIKVDCRHVNSGRLIISGPARDVTYLATTFSSASTLEILLLGCDEMWVLTGHDGRWDLRWSGGHQESNLNSLQLATLVAMASPSEDIEVEADIGLVA